MNTKRPEPLWSITKSQSYYGALLSCTCRHYPVRCRSDKRTCRATEFTRTLNWSIFRLKLYVNWRVYGTMTVRLMQRFGLQMIQRDNIISNRDNLHLWMFRWSSAWNCIWWLTRWTKLPDHWLYRIIEMKEHSARALQLQLEGLKLNDVWIYEGVSTVICFATWQFALLNVSLKHYLDLRGYLDNRNRGTFRCSTITIGKFMVESSRIFSTEGSFRSTKASVW